MSAAFGTSRVHRRAAATLALVAVAALLAGCSPEAPPAPAPRPVQLVQAKAGGIAETTVFAGEVKPRHESDLGFRIGGKVVERRVDVGARVTRGQPLARLDPADVGLQAEAQKAAVAAARTEAAFAKAEYDRYRNLLAQKFVSESAVDQKRNAAETATARLAQAEAQLAVTRNQASYATLVAPADGVITALAVEAGQVVTAGQTVMKFAREDEREIAISVPENRIGEIRAAKGLAIALWANRERIYAGRVREIAPAVDPVTRTFAVRVSVADPDPALQWGMTANVALQKDEAAGATLLPAASLYRQDEKPAVWIWDPQTKQVSLRAVVVAQYREDGVLVSAGVRDGEWVVAAGVNKLRPGEAVRPWDANAAPPALRADARP